jgi:hypothetical protein
LSFSFEYRFLEGVSPPDDTLEIGRRKVTEVLLIIVFLLIEDTSKIQDFSFAQISRWMDVERRFKHEKLMMIENDSNENLSEGQKYTVNPAEVSLFPIFCSN